jgi:hypothetical protein
VVSPEISRCVLEAVLAAHPDDGVVQGLRLRVGWGNAYHIDVDTRYLPGTTRDHERCTEVTMRAAILEALTPSRAVVSFTNFDLWTSGHEQGPSHLMSGDNPS